MNLGALFSGGKDSVYATYLMLEQGQKISCLISIKSTNPDSWMFHTVNVEMVELHTQAIGVPLLSKETLGLKERELLDLKDAIESAVKCFEIQGIVTGAWASRYQKNRIEDLCKELQLKCFSPLWGKKPEQLMKNMIKDGFEIIVTAISAKGFDESWLGRRIDLHALEKLIELNKRFRIHVAGEGGEYETLVIDCPIFNKKIRIVEAGKKMFNENTGKLLINKAKLVEKKVKKNLHNN